MARKTWEQRFREADSLYTTQACGCLALVLVDMPDVVKTMRDDIVEQSLMGRSLNRCKRGELPPLNCAEHARATA